MKLINKISQNWHFIVLAIFSLFVLSNCEEESLNLNLDGILQDSLEVIETILPVDLYTISTETINTLSIGTSPYGVVNDSVFGILETEFISDFIYSSLPSFMDIDSLEYVSVLDFTVELAYSSYYGILTDVDFEVYELTEAIPDYTKSDYVLHSHMYSPNSILKEFEIGHDEVSIPNDQYDTCYLTLTDEYAQKFLDPLLEDHDTLYIYESGNQALFKDRFKGLYFAINSRSSEGGGIIKVNQAASRMVLRTQEWNSESEAWDTVSNIFSLGNSETNTGSGGVLNLYRSTLSPNVEQVFNDTLNLSSHAYLQSLTGPRIYLRIPSLVDLRKTLGNSASVNFAHLILPFDSSNYERDKDRYAAPTSLGILEADSSSAIIDDTWAENYLGGGLDTINYQYKLNLGNHVHEFLRDDESELGTDFYLFPSKGSSPVLPISFTPSRIVLNGSTSANPPKLRIVYSIIPE